MPSPIPGPACIEALESRVFLSAGPLATTMSRESAVAVLARQASAVGTIIDHNAVAGVARISTATLQRIAASFNFFFAHASVGGNILDGLRSVHDSNPKRYRLAVADDDESPPRRTAKGVVYNIDRGNPSWQEKVDGFAGYLKAGWAGKVNVAVNKFCFIDPDVSLQYYAASNRSGTAMSQLEARYPKLRFVYTTIPLTIDADEDNIQRNTFNASLRTWCKANGKLLLDIADIEAWGPGGRQATFRSGGKTMQRLNPAYSEDGGHLNLAGSRVQALGWYALGASLLV